MDTTVLFAIIGAIIVSLCLFLSPILLTALFLRKVGPDQAMIVYGAGGTKVIVEGSNFVLSRFQQAKC
jgi:flotillin